RWRCSGWRSCRRAARPCREPGVACNGIGPLQAKPHGGSRFCRWYARRMSMPRLALLASPTEDAQAALKTLVAIHGAHAPQDADVLVALGGDGFMLQTLHRHGALGKAVYGMKLGSVGFLMNHHRAEDADGDLQARIAAAEPAVLHPLEML